jgi:hypothetical protein
MINFDDNNFTLERRIKDFILLKEISSTLTEYDFNANILRLLLRHCVTQP